MSLKAAWAGQAGDWELWARKPDHDSYWRFHRNRFLSTLPKANPNELVLDFGCGEGRVGRDLRDCGHKVVAVDSALSMTKAAASHAESTETLCGDGTALPFQANSFSLCVAFMVLHDMDDPETGLAEIARVLTPRGRAAIAVVHPINSSGDFQEPRGPESPYVIPDSYLQAARYQTDISRDGLSMTFHSAHRPIEFYCQAAFRTGFQVTGLAEVGTNEADDKWSRIPLFLHLTLELCE